MKKIGSFLMLVLMALILAACGETTKDPQGFQFVDDLGRTVSVSDASRTAALLGSFADMWTLAGGEICASADDAWDDFALPLGEEAINLGSMHRPNKEELIAAQPTFVLASAKLSKHLEMQETLDAMGIAVAYFDVDDFDDFLRVLRVMTQILDTPEQYETYGVAQQERVEKCLDLYRDRKAQTVLVMRASAANIRAKNSEDTVLGGMLADFGCINIADSDSMLLDNLSVESILLKNPDKIFFIQTADEMDKVKAAVEAMFLENPLWNTLDAVKNGKIYYMDKHLYNLKPNARFAEGYEKLGNLLYAE
jgi:iron complex transport system substrate-binding protein